VVGCDHRRSLLINPRRPGRRRLGVGVMRTCICGEMRLR
jgi:hypothetical protein